MGNCSSRSKSSGFRYNSRVSPCAFFPLLLRFFMDAVESIREKCIDPAERIDRLILFIENQLNKMNTPSEAGSSSSEGWLETEARDLAVRTIDTICKELEEISGSAAVQAVGSRTLRLMRGLGELQWVFIGLSVAGFGGSSYMSGGSSYMSGGSRRTECRKLLLKVLELAKEVKQYNELMLAERGKLLHAVGNIVEGAIMCYDYIKLGDLSRFWLAPTTAAAQLEKTNLHIRDLRDCLSVVLQIPKPSPMPTDEYPPAQYDVFLSHSGRQKNFVRQLHRDLTREHVSCFFDENSLPLAERFSTLIFQAAATCKIAVLVLSKDFIRSKWPMLELSAFIKARNSGRNANLKLFPIFFMINPNELSHISKDSPEWKEFNVSDDTRGEWQDALRVVRSINGLHFREDENAVVFRDKIVKALCCLVKRINPLKLLEFEPVGVKEQVEELKALMDMEGAESALTVIVCGFGGLGKSTLAASVIQSLDWSSMDFKFCRVTIDERTPDKTSHVVKLQKEILYHLGGVNLNLPNPDEGRVRIKEVLENECCFLFIDNVVDKDYIRDLLPKDLSSGKQTTKLRILVTSREEDVQAKFNITCKVYKVHTLSKAASQRLLFDTILEGKVAERDFDEKSMINEVAYACRGVPLLLSVFGQHLRTERDKDSYQEALNVLREGNLDSYRDEELGTKLMFVYNKIKDVEVREAFMDICSYFHGWKWKLVADIVDIATLKDLRRRMLVSTSGSGNVIVHDILRLMGIKEASLTRFSNYKDFSEAFEDNLDGFDVEKVKGISLVNDKGLVTIQSTHLEAMHRTLRVLLLGDWVTLDGPPCQKAFRNLRYLRVGDINVFPFKDPSKLNKLRAFLNWSKPGMNLPHLPSSLKHISHETPSVKCYRFANLQVQNLSSLESFVVKTLQSVELQELHLPASLVNLDLIGCKNLPKDIGHLTALKSLILDRSDLKRLPQGFGKLKKLEHLSMEYCSKLAFLCEELGMLSSLEALRMSNCENLIALPKSFGALRSLQELELIGSIKLQQLPESIGELRIQKLVLHSVVNLQELPNSFGNMPLLKDLRLESCHSLMSLPDSFVELKMLETLNIIMCTKLSIVVKDFDQLRCLNSLKHLTVEDCPRLKELPHGFGALGSLKTFTLRRCKSFVNLPTDFTELTGLEDLVLQGLPLISRIPDGLGKLKKLRFLFLAECFQLETLSDDFENMATLELLEIPNCPELDGAMMEKILKLQHCYKADIRGSRKLIEKWKEMQSEIEHPIAVLSGAYRDDQEENRGRAMRVPLLNGKCVVLNDTSGQFVERSLLLVGLEEGITATVALIMLPIHMQSHQHQTLLRFVEMAREIAKTNGSGMLQIVCARKVELDAERSTATGEDEKAEEEGICQILLSLPKGSCAIPSSEARRLKILTYCCDSNNDYLHNLSFFMANVGVDIEGRKSLENLKFTMEYELPGNMVIEPPPSEIRNTENIHYNSIQKFIQSICPEYSRQPPSQSVAGESKTTEFVEALKDNGIDYLLIDDNTNKVMVDDLHGKTIGFFICNFEFLECIKLQQIYKDLQQDSSNFLAIWIPTMLPWPTGCGYGSYTRLIQCMPWATFPHPQLVNIPVTEPGFVVLDKGGQIVNQDALGLLLAWGVKSYPFTRHTIPESFFSMESESCLEFLLHGMNIDGRKPMRRKMTFLYVERPREVLEMKFKLEQLIQMDASFEVLYLGKFFGKEFKDRRKIDNIKHLKQEYEDAVQNMPWPSLSFSDMMMFWYRCKYLASQEGDELHKNSNTMMKTLHGLANQLCGSVGSLVLVGNDGIVTSGGLEVVQMICESSDEISEGEGRARRMVKEELMKSLSRGECSPMVKTFFLDEIHNHPQHPQHPIISSSLDGVYWCNVCYVSLCRKEKRSYRCDDCDWDMCGSCWMAYAIQQVEQVLLANHN